MRQASKLERFPPTAREISWSIYIGKRSSRLEFAATSASATRRKLLIRASHLAVTAPRRPGKKSKKHLPICGAHA
jgi:hypothetical protein